MHRYNIIDLYTHISVSSGIINKVLPEKLDMVRDYFGRYA